MFFDLIHKEKNSRARAGVIHTDHGDIPTPVFMPVGTQATVKSLDSADLHALDAPIILGNTYHLHLRPGEDLIARAGGLHKFMNWDRPILTDSGGFQVFSLGAQKERKNSQETNEKGDPVDGGKLVDIDEDGVTFRSHIDGSTHRFTPESAIETQQKIGADIIMAFDECTPDNASESYTREAMERTHRWAARCAEAFQNKKHAPAYRQFLFGIIQGSNRKPLREESAKAIAALNFDGIAIGGESVGYNMEATKDILDWVMPHLPEDKPHYAMGLGFSPMDLFEVVERGVDMFDCVAPTRMARTGTLFIRDANHRQSAGSRPQREKKFRLNITNAQFREDPGPIDPACTCPTCQGYSRRYLHHLFNTQELLAYRLATIHNLHFFLSLMRDMRAAILDDRFLELKKAWAKS